MDLFQRPGWFLAALAAALLSAGLLRWSEERRRRIAALFAREETLARLFPARALARRRLKFALEAGTLVLGLLALAGPQWGVELVAAQGSGIQAVIAIDVSLSMLAEDLKPSRMERAKEALSLFIDGLKGERVGLIAFAGEAQMQCPITTDSDAVKSLLRRVSPGMVSPPGTAIGKAVALGGRMLQRYPGQKALVLLTDGEDHGSKPEDAVRAAAAAGVRLYVIGMGTPEGAPIPLRDGAGAVTGYKKDSHGQTVVTRLGEKPLIELAAAGGGAYYRASPSDEEVGKILDQIRALEKSRAPTSATNRYRNRYRFPLAAAVLLLLLELLTPELGSESGPSFLERLAAKAKAGAPLALALAALGLSGCGAPTDMRLWRGNSAYGKEKFDEALKRYEGAARAAPKDPRPVFNSGAALYKMGEHERASQAFESLSDPKKTPPPLAVKSLYNMGNALYRGQKKKESIEAYKKCLLADPADEDCRYNLVVALKDQKKDQDKKDQNKDQDKKDQDKKDDKNRPQSGGGTPPPQQGLSREDAERILQAVREKERAAMKQLPAQRESARPGNGPVAEDW
ncbi:MAG TPA: VWA domain-containing protein [Elusimicrobiota bacterium]|jgi:Ca-activated chloride channel family protein|nr:VWA domain-containing protein [Elusimicrobiota bacterium]